MRGYNRAVKVDFEAILPFQIFALMFAPVAFGYPEHAFRIWAGALLAAQLMIFNRSIDRRRGERLGYLLSNELYCALSIAAIVVVPAMLAGKF